MSGLPRGTLTLLFTDIEGSTIMLRRLRDRYGAVLDEHARILRAAFQEYGGREVDTQGDAFFAVFTTAKDALLAAVAAQRALAGHDWPEDAAVRVRIGLHTGEPATDGARYVGLTVHRAARIMAAGHGGQILVSEATRRLLDEEELAGLRLRDLGLRRLKDIAEPERIFQVDVPGLPASFPPLKAEPARPGRRRLLRRRVLLALAAVLALGIAAAGVAVAVGRGDGAPAVEVLPNSVAVIDPASNRVVADVQVGLDPTAVAVGEDGVWVANEWDSSISRIDPQTRAVVRTTPLGAPGVLNGLAVGAGAVWVGSGRRGDLVLSRVRPASGAVDATATIGRAARTIPNAWPVAVGGGSVWVGSTAAGAVLRLDPRTLRRVGSTDVGLLPTALAVTADSAWVANESGVLVRVDTESGRLSATLEVPDGAFSMAATENALWVVGHHEDVVALVRPDSLSVVEVPVGDAPVAVAVGFGSVWVANGGEGTVSRIDPRSNRVVETIPIGRKPQGIAAGAGGVWVSVGSEEATPEG